MKKRIFSVSILISIGLLVAVYYRIDWRSFFEIILNIKLKYIFYLLISFAVIFSINSVRWIFLTKERCHLSFFTGLVHILGSGALNLVTPSKMGSMSKSIILKSSYGVEWLTALFFVTYEKASDLFGLTLVYIGFYLLSSSGGLVLDLVLWGCLGYASLFISLHTPLLSIFLRSSGRLLESKAKTSDLAKMVFSRKRLFENPSKAIRINMISLLGGLCHAWQMYLFFLILKIEIPGTKAVTGMLASIFAGMLPVSIAGLGTRDAMIVHVFKGAITLDQAAAVSLLVLSRYIVPTLIGLPFFMSLMRSGYIKPSPSALHGATSDCAGGQR